MLNNYGGCLEDDQFRADFDQPVGLLEQDLFAARWRMNHVRMREPGFFALQLALIVLDDGQRIRT